MFISWDLVTTMAVACDLYHFQNHQTIQWAFMHFYGNIVVLEDIPIRTEMFYRRIKVISQNNFVGLEWLVLLRGQVDLNHASKLTEPLDSITVCVKHSALYASLVIHRTGIHPLFNSMVKDDSSNYITFFYNYISVEKCLWFLHNITF